MGVYKRILVPVEGTDTDGPVLDHIAELAAMCGAEVTLLRVAHYHTRDERAYELEDAEGSLERAAELLRSRGVRGRVALSLGVTAALMVGAALAVAAWLASGDLGLVSLVGVGPAPLPLALAGIVTVGVGASIAAAWPSRSSDV